MMTSAHPWNDVRIFVKMCRTLAERGYDVHLVVPRENAPPVEVVQKVTIHRVPKSRSRLGRMLGTVARVYRRAKALRGDIYHFHDPELLPAGFLLKAAGNLAIYDVHEDLPSQILSKAWIWGPLRKSISGCAKMLESFAGRILDGFVGATPSIAQRFAARRTVAVQNFPLPDELGIPEAESVPYADRPANVAYVGGITKIRGILEVVQSLALVPAESHARLEMAGEVWPKGLREEMQALPGFERVTDRGYCNRQEVARLLGRCRLGLVTFLPEPNHIEAQPNKLFEYMAAGLPVVASHFPLWKQLVDEHGCGITVDPCSPREIAGAIQWLLAHPTEAEAMGQRGQKLVRESLNWNTQIQILHDFYQGILREDRHRRGSQAAIHQSRDREQTTRRAA